MIKTEQLYYLTQVAKYNSIHKAAEKLYMTSAAVSSAMKQLEKECGYAILERTYRGVKLTEKGQQVLNIAKQILSLCDNLIEIGETEDVKIETIQRYNLIVSDKVSALLSKKLVGGSSQVMRYFNFIESKETNQLLSERVSDDTLVVMIAFRAEMNELEQLGENQISEIYASPQYPFSSKTTKFIPKGVTRITQEEYNRLPKISRSYEKIGSEDSNVVLQTSDMRLYVEAIFNDLGIGILTQFAPDLQAIDRSMFRIYEPFGEEYVIFCVHTPDRATDAQKLIALLKNQY